jgi:hypothetical protein
MDNVLTLGVYRNLDNRAEGLSDLSERAKELHDRRKVALHDALEGTSEFRVTDWGNTDDTRPHEFVSLVLAAAGSATFHYAIVPGLKWLGEKIAEKAVDTAAEEFVKAIVSNLRPKQEAKQILDFTISLPGGTIIGVDPPAANAKISIWLAGGAVQSIEYEHSP